MSDRDYLRLARNPDANAGELRELVDSTARRAGYTEDVYHWTFLELKTLGEKPNLGEFFLRDAPIPLADKRAIGLRMDMHSTRQLGDGLYVSRDPVAWEWYAAGSGFKSAKLRHGTIPKDVLERIVANPDALDFFATPGDKYRLPFRPKRDLANYHRGGISRQLMLNLIECAIDQKISILGSLTHSKPPMRVYHMKYNPCNLVAADSYYEASSISGKDVENLCDNEIVVRGVDTLKFADLVVCDDDGVIVPLSRRFSGGADLRGGVCPTVSLSATSHSLQTPNHSQCHGRQFP